MMNRFSVFFASLLATLMAAAPANAGSDLLQLSLRDLMDIQITSVSKKAEPLSGAAAAVFVITQEDIRRSGMTSIPELLRLVPGMQVAQIDANVWAISARGFNGRWSNKLLVLIDGRSVYTPLFSGVYWDTQDTLLEDIERIEVIRGPGGSLWGTNAVNGVINIITQHARESRETLVAARAGDTETGVSLRYGGTLGDAGWFRVFAKTTDHDGYAAGDQGPVHDAYDQWRTGFRADWQIGSRDALTLQGEHYDGHSGQTVGNLSDLLAEAQFSDDTIDVSGHHLMMRWRRDFSEASDMELRAYYDRAERDDLILAQDIRTLDVELRHRFAFGERQEINWGLSYRRLDDRIDDTFTVQFDMTDVVTETYAAFVQDEIALRDDLRLTLGSKFEHNDYSGLEVQPSARIVWSASGRQTVWGALSRAVRSPGRTDHGIRINVATFSSPFVDPDGPGPLPAGAPTLISILGSEDVNSEEVLAFEIGYRAQPVPAFSLDMAFFYNDYDELLTFETDFGLETVPAPAHALIGRTFDNRMQGTTYGVDLTGKWQVTPGWRLLAGYSLLKEDFRLDPDSTDTGADAELEDGSSGHRWSLQSQWQISDRLELDASLLHVDSIVVRSGTGPSSRIPAYERLDLRLGWRPSANLELSLVGQNLLEEAHLEYVSLDILSSTVARTVYGRVSYEFD
jgi:iron complex outermembrane receptor protein